MNWLCNTPLEGKLIRLEPIAETHLEGLKQAVRDGESWKLWYASVPSPDTMQDYLQRAIEESHLNPAYAVIDINSENVLGTTRFYQTDETNRRTKLGYTWYASAVRRTGVNTECKYLMLKHAFEQHQAIAVEFNTHYFNFTSRNAIERLGAKQDGILRQHQIMPDGSFRDTVVYSIIHSEWLAVKQHLQTKLNPLQSV